MDNSAHAATWPAWATEPVALVAPDPGWPDQARAYAHEVADLLHHDRNGALDPVEHVGSTAIPGIPAKPVVDLTTRLPDPASWCAAHRDALERRSWHLVPPELDSEQRRLLVRVDAAGAHRLAHLHLLWPDSPRFVAFRTFRDRLRADAALATEYAALKRALAIEHADDREAYTASKADFVARVLGGDATG